MVKKYDQGCPDICQTSTNEILIKNFEKLSIENISPGDVLMAARLAQTCGLTTATSLATTNSGSSTEDIVENEIQNMKHFAKHRITQKGGTSENDAR